MGLYSVLTKGLWEKVYSRTLGAMENTFTIDSLDGNADQLWYLYCRLVAAQTGTHGYWLRLNNDSGANYGYQRVSGSGSTVSAVRYTPLSYWALGGSSGSFQIIMHRGIIYPKAGFVRTIVSLVTDRISGTTVGYVTLLGQSWQNTVDKVTSLVFLGDAANLYGPGSHIELWRKLA